MQVLTAPGVMIHEIDKSQYSPAMDNTACYIMGFSNMGEAYQPQEFTSRTAWINYYGEPDTEAERYFYAAACEVLNNNGRLYCARLPYDNKSFEKVACFKYTISEDTISASDSPFYEIYNTDNTIDIVAKITPSLAPIVYDLSAIDAYRTDEEKVGNRSILIADIAFNSYNRVQEDSTRKDDKRELIGIMPVITTAANALYAQDLIAVDDLRVYNYETIGEIKTLNASDIEGIEISSMILSTSDLAKPVNSRDHYNFISSTNEISSSAVAVNSSETKSEIDTKILEVCNTNGWTYTGSYLLSTVDDSTSAVFSYKYDKPLDLADDRYGWHNPNGDDSLPDTVSLEAASYFPTIQTFTDENGDLRFERQNLKKIGVIVYKLFMDPSEGNKVNFTPVEAFAGSLGKDDKDQDTGVTTFIDTIVNTLSKYINLFSNCFNTSADKTFYNNKLDMVVVNPPKTQIIDTSKANLNIIKSIINAAKAINNGLGDNAVAFDTSSIDAFKTTLNYIKEAVSNYSPTYNDTIAKLIESFSNVESAIASTTKPDDDTSASLGFYWKMVKEDISIDKSIYDGINKCFEKVADINERNIDIVCDAGIANIASYLKAIYGNKGEYDLTVTDDVGNSLLNMWKCNGNNSAVKAWKVVEQKYDTFCKNVRKDCMFIADGLRPLVIQGLKKVIRSTKPTNTIDSQILPYVKYLTGLNTSYGAGYLDWFEQADDYSGDFFWCPPSIKAMGVYLNTDANFMYWDAPAGLNRGIIAATDVAFSPTMAQAGSIYEKNWNYAINYPQDGIVLEGQKTFQVKPSAFDRVNVRRLFCRLERQAYKVSRYFVYEGNTAYTRQRLVDALDPYFKEAKVGGGIYEYKIKCDEENNTSETIDRNELHCAIGIKPVKTAEFIYIDFVALRTGGSWEEAGF